MNSIAIKMYIKYDIYVLTVYGNIARAVSHLTLGTGIDSFPIQKPTKNRY